MAVKSDGASAPANKTFRWNVWLGAQSSRLSHAVFIGLIVVAAAPRLTGVTPTSLPLVTSPPLALANAKPTLQDVRDAGPDELPIRLRSRKLSQDFKASDRPARGTLAASDMASVPLSAITSPDAAAISVEPDAAPLAREKLVRLRVRSLPSRDAAAPVRVDDKPVTRDVAVEAPIGVVKKRVAYTVAPSWSEEQIAEARNTCASLLSGVDVTVSETPPLREGTCGTPAPVSLSRVGLPKVAVQPAVLLTCPMAAALHVWITDKVQPAAKEAFGAPVVRLLSASSYSCRNRYGKTEGALSEHAAVNALDLAGFVLADGRTIRVAGGWGPVVRDMPMPFFEVAETVRKPPLKAGLSMLGGAKPKPEAVDPAKANDAKPEKGGEKKGAKPEAKIDDFNSKRMAFLKAVHRDACGIFGTVLGPEANSAHSDHFHLDMKPRKRRSYCQ